MFVFFRRFVFLFIFFLGMAPLSAVFAITVAGGGSCESWNKAVAKDDNETGEFWVMGFLSGRSYESDFDLLKDLEWNDIIKEIDLSCRKEPGKTLSRVAIEFFDRRKTAPVRIPQEPSVRRPGSACSASDVQVSKFTTRRQGNFVYATGVLRHDCAGAQGVELTWTGYFSDGSVAFSRSFWPNSTSNIPPGVEFPFETMNSVRIPIERSTISVKSVRAW